MKSALLIPMLTSALLAGLVETNEGTFLELYSDYNIQSDIISKVSTEKGRLDRQRCRKTRDESEWCKVTYTLSGISVTGWSDKRSLDTIASKPNKRPTFEKNYGGQYSDIGNDILALKDGFLIVGQTDSFGKGQNDVYLMKTDKFGNKLWSFVYGGKQNDVAYSVTAINDGFMIAGKTGSFGNRDQSLYVARISNDGRLVWQNGYYSDKDDYYVGKSILQTDDNHVVVAGSEDHMKFFDSDVYCQLTGININGQKEWIKNYGGEDTDRANSIIRSGNNFVFAGVTDTWGHGGDDAYVVKVNNKGQRVWHNAFGYGYDEEANQIITTKDGGYLVVGTTESDHRNAKDVYVVKVNENGTRAWQKHYGSTEDEEGLDVVEVENGYVIAGYTKDTKSYKSDVYLLKIDRIGNIFWEKKYGGNNDEKGHAIAKTDDGFVVTGYTSSTADHSKDLYILKVDNNGNMN